MLGARTAGLGLALGLASFALVDNTMFIGRYCEPVMIIMMVMMMMPMMMMMVMIMMMMEMMMNLIINVLFRCSHQLVASKGRGSDGLGKLSSARHHP